MLRYLAVALAILVLSSAAIQAKMPTIGEGDKLQFDPSAIPPDKMKTYELMMEKCGNPKCHSIARAVLSVNTGRTPMTHVLFDKAAAKGYGVKMLRQPDSNINKDQARDIVGLLYYMMDRP